MRESVSVNRAANRGDQEKSPARILARGLHGTWITTVGAVAAALSMASCTSSSPSQPTAASTSLTPSNLSASTTTSAPSTGVVSCAFTDLKAVDEDAGGLAGNVLYDISLTNIAGHPCYLSGYPAVLVAVFLDHTEQTIPTGRGPALQPLTPGILKPGESGLEEITIPHNGCEARYPPIKTYELLFLGEPQKQTEILTGTGHLATPLTFDCGEATFSPMGIPVHQ
jgi:hypothetical protein